MLMTQNLLTQVVDLLRPVVELKINFFSPFSPSRHKNAVDLDLPEVTTAVKTNLC